PYNELSTNSITAENLIQAAKDEKLTLGGGASILNIYDNVKTTFVFDQDAGTVPGEWHYKFSLSSSDGKAAYFRGLDGMTNAAEKMEIQFMSSLSNGEDLYGFSPDAPPVYYYNQLQYTPQRLFSY